MRIFENVRHIHTHLFLNGFSSVQRCQIFPAASCPKLGIGPCHPDRTKKNFTVTQKNPNSNELKNKIPIRKSMNLIRISTQIQFNLRKKQQFETKYIQ